MISISGVQNNEIESLQLKREAVVLQNRVSNSYLPRYNTKNTIQKSSNKNVEEEKQLGNYIEFLLREESFKAFESIFSVDTLYEETSKNQKCFTKEVIDNFFSNGSDAAHRIAVTALNATESSQVLEGLVKYVPSQLIQLLSKDEFSSINRFVGSWIMLDKANMLSTELEQPFVEKLRLLLALIPNTIQTIIESRILKQELTPHLKVSFESLVREHVEGKNSLLKFIEKLKCLKVGAK